MKKISTALFLGSLTMMIQAHCIDFDQIEHWTGEGPNRAALVVQFGGAYSSSDAYVWGYRWQDGETPNGEDMVKAICGNSDELIILTQYTGQYGATLCGVGFGNADSLLDKVYFDFEMALDYPFITFDYFNNNSWFGQAEAPGENTPKIMQQAIEEARETHVIQHPLDYQNYGYPAYDYDCWKLLPSDKGDKWQSAWYEGYWSFWLSSSDQSSDWMYSGTGFTGAMLYDGSIHGWTFTQFENAMVGGVGEGNPPTNDIQRINYRPSSKDGAGITLIELSESELTEYYTLSGVRVAPSSGFKGIVVVKTGRHSRKELWR